MISSPCWRCTNWPQSSWTVSTTSAGGVRTELLHSAVERGNWTVFRTLNQKSRSCKVRRRACWRNEISSCQRWVKQSRTWQDFASKCARKPLWARSRFRFLPSTRPQTARFLFSFRRKEKVLMVSLLFLQFPVCLMGHPPADQGAARQARNRGRSPRQPCQPLQPPWSRPHCWNPVGREAGSQTSASRWPTSAPPTSELRAPPAVDFPLKFWCCLESRAWPCLLAFSSLASRVAFWRGNLF